MPRQPPVFNPYFENLKSILELVQAQVRRDGRVTVHCYFLSETPRHPSFGYIGFSWEADRKIEKVTHQPGIPLESLLQGEKHTRIADWIVKQIRKDHPEWFMD